MRLPNHPIKQKLIYRPGVGNPYASIVVLMGTPDIHCSTQMGNVDIRNISCVPVLPSEGRAPTPEECDSWIPHLRRELDLGCRHLICVGRIAQATVRRNITSIPNYIQVHYLVHDSEIWDRIAEIVELWNRENDHG